ncbi:efflux RND transporter periplasmic adaptor subunit [Polluticoccus soli]|uniref:efflux RND transporter periplasmic adaptor subunit n=1 Tax=Polluticoccus soli TaxID=3034150 RepID=UPI0023E25043|nr:efflux RND transporter periplasmic adaptor subunit [Flavipsychrobacter sp. JY13-12]
MHITRNPIFKRLIVVAIPVFLLVACRSKKTVEESSAFTLSDTMMAKCDFYKATMEPVKNEIRLFGKISADNNKLAQVYPVVGGVVTNINVELGDYVRQGQILATIRSTEIAQFQKERLDAMNDVAVSEKNLQVAKDLFAGKLNSEKDVIAAQKELQKTKAELNRVNEVYKIYNLKSGSIYNVVAPISGFVVTKKINQNEQIRSDNNEPLFSIAEINEVWALANVNESDISRIQEGYNAEVKTIAFPDKAYYGKIDKIFNAIDPETRSMKVLVKIPNADFKLKPEMNCTVAVRYIEDHQLVAVPASAIVFDKSKYWIMVFKDRHNIETRKVDVYRQVGDISYIKSGINAGETVISKNGLLVYDALND